MHVRAWRVAYRDLVPADVLEALSVERRAEAWTRLIGRPERDGFTLVAEVDGRVAGFCSVLAPARDDDLGDRTAEVGALYVEPDLWRRGIGTALLEAALERLDAGGPSGLVLWVFASNRPARSFYARFGFRADGAERRREWVGGEPEVRLALRVGARS